MKAAGTKGASRPSKIFRVKVFLALSIFTLISSTLGAKTLEWGTINSSFKPYYQRGVEIHTDSNKNQSLRLFRKNYPLSYDASLESVYLNFSKKPTGPNILKSKYRPLKSQGSVGLAASFEKPQHQIWLNLPKYLFFNRRENAGNFSIQFMMKPYAAKYEMEIMRRIGIFERKKRGIVCLWRKGKILFRFYNIFESQRRLIEFLEIATTDTINLNQFHKVLLTFDETSGKLSLHLNRQEQRSIFITHNKSPNGSVAELKFHKWDNSPLIIGKNYLGSLDEIILSNRLLDHNNPLASYGRVMPNGNHFSQSVGIFTSMPGTMQYSNSTIKNFSVQKQQPKHTFIRVKARVSNSPFPANLSQSILPYVDVAKLRNKKGRYVQWQAELFSDPEGKETPILRGIRIDYEDNPAPRAPRNLQARLKPNGSIAIHFLRNAEMDVINGGRYHIYYGIEPYQAIGLIRYKKVIDIDRSRQAIAITDKDRYFTDDLRFQNQIYVELDNTMIRENLLYTKDKPSLQFANPQLQKDIPFYFWVTACDNSYGETLDKSDHESKPSNYVIVRP